uniref:Phospholipase/carboxylesterase/thioesterase domain-containing protein n=1 Tax=Hordeum vulgare subsp. vulgare TaxID=112509 RepID=A0A8I6X736_HORVV
MSTWRSTKIPLPQLISVVELHMGRGAEQTLYRHAGMSPSFGPEEVRCSSILDSRSSCRYEVRPEHGESEESSDNVADYIVCSKQFVSAKVEVCCVTVIPPCNVTYGHSHACLDSECQVTLGIGGFSMGVAAALHSAACYAHGKFSSGTPYQIMLSAIVSLSRWLPCSRMLMGKMEGSHMARLMEFLRSLGFSYVSFKSYNGLGHYTILEEMDDGLGHYTILEEMDDLCKWLSSRLSIDRSW